MLNPKIQEAFNRQLNAELHSSYLYLSMAAYFDSENLAGMAAWMRIQAQEELTHALKFFDFINERDGRVITAFNMHPGGNVDRRTNLYFAATGDMGETWRTVDGRPLVRAMSRAAFRDDTFYREGEVTFVAFTPENRRVSVEIQG